MEMTDNNEKEEPKYMDAYCDRCKRTTTWKEIYVPVGMAWLTGNYEQRWKCMGCGTKR